MTRFASFFAAALAVVGSAAASAVIDLTPDNFDSVVLKSGKPALVEFFAPWCGHCKTLAPIYEELATAFESSKDKVVIAKVDADEHKDLGRKFGVQGFPTLKWFDGKSKDPIDYSSGRDLESLSAFITEKTGIKTKTKRADKSHVEMLTDTTFKQAVGADKNVLVAFTAPWCGHCKTLAPTWEKLANDFAYEPNVTIAKVDCEAPNAKAVAKAAGVSSYPTIKFYPKGSSEPIDYSGGRAQAELISYINDKTGTHRIVGGGLDAIAGTIPALDKLVGSLKSGGAAAYTELEKATVGLQDKYAEYYNKVAKKAQDNAQYVEKELARLQSLLKKGGLSPEKLDDLTSRSNILSIFSKDETVSPKEEL
ncbi:hypothetical protein AMS68_000878 [Peltaster fructicola]|uniref:protein disulfide-isomerase n=1 Tax=Peltaster fructicola TaxID=286661 RepID=A0A6H0XL51_9PEZI|nr:hypothetical protein AMS68_000878 [Peltaster fructicola]